MPPGMLLVFEGAEGVGKSTQARLLGERLQRGGVDCLAVREPGGTRLGDAVRDLLLDPGGRVAPASEALLFMASRAQLVDEVIRPALRQGRIVIADRFFLSTYAYQIAGRQLPEDAVRSANRLATGGLVPDCTLLLDLPAPEGFRRAAARGAHDRMEASGNDFHARVSAALAEFSDPAWQEAHPECGPIVRVDAAGAPDEVAARVNAVVDARLPKTPGGLAGSHR